MKGDHMKIDMRHHARLMATLAIAGLAAVSPALVACGGTNAPAESSASSSSTTTGSAAGSAAGAATGSAAGSAAPAAAADPTAKFIGTWKLAAAETDGVTMSGNFGDLVGVGQNGTMTINEDGSGSLSFDNQAVGIAWTAGDDNSISVAFKNSTETESQDAFTITYQDGALLFPMDSVDGQLGTLYFTPDGTYAGAKIISLDDATPITDASALIGTWKMVGMNMGGVSFYGDVSSFSSMMGGQETVITFKEGGVADTSGNEGSWEVTADGATLTSNDAMGTNTVPAMMLDGNLALDYSQAIGDTQFIIVLAKQ